MPNLTINNTVFFYTISRKPIASINIHLLSRRLFRISCHYLTPQIFIHHFIKKHQQWIYQNSQKIISYPDLSKLKKLTILGHKYSVTFLPSTVNKLTINFYHRTIIISTSTNSPKNIKKIITTYFKSFTRKMIKKQISLYPHYQKMVKYIYLRNQKTRFGSCSSRQSLSFNWQIIFFPLDKFNHIICHELVHLVEKNHQKRFYQKLADLDPNWQINNKWLKTDAKKHFLIKP